MFDGAAGVATLSYAGILLTGIVLQEKQISSFGIIALAGHATLAMMSRVETDPSVVWQIGAFATTLIMGLEIKKFNPRPTRRERKLWRQLFGEQTVWEMLIHDPRIKNLKTWRMKQ